MQQEDGNSIIDFGDFVNKVNVEPIDVCAIVMPLIHFFALLFPAKLCFPCLNQILDGPARRSIFPT